jgi:hypothetical protein
LVAHEKPNPIRLEFDVKFSRAEVFFAETEVESDLGSS